MKRILQAMGAPARTLRRALARAPRWVRLVWVLAMATACAFGVTWAQDDAFGRGYASGRAEVLHPEPELPSWLPAGTDRARALEAMEQGVPFQVESHDEGYGCAARFMLLPNGQLWWLRYTPPGGTPLTWEVGARDYHPQMGCFNMQLPKPR